MDDNFNINENSISQKNNNFQKNDIDINKFNLKFNKPNETTLKQTIPNQFGMIIRGVGLNALKSRLFVVQPTKTNSSSPTFNADQAYMSNQETDSQKDFNRPANSSQSANRFGLDIYDTLVLSGDGLGNALKYDAYDNNGRIQKKTLPYIELILLNIEVTMIKNIVRTPISGRNGTVKEYMSDGDYDISITGMLVSDYPDSFPQDQVDLLKAYCDANVPIAVSSNRLSTYGIKSIVITDYTFKQTEGMRNVVPFELLCISEIPYELQIK